MAILPKLRKLYIDFQKCVPLLAAVLGLSVTAPSVAAGPIPKVLDSALGERLTGDNTVRVIVGLAGDFDGKPAVLARAQQALVARLGTTRTQVLKRYQVVPFLVLRLDRIGFAALSADPQVASVREDTRLRPLLTETVPLLRADAAWNVGATGRRQKIAIIDTGVDSTHPFLAGKVVLEACYSTNSAEDGITSLCPNGAQAQIGTGSGINCPTSISGCGHGTHVAGIAAGRGSSFSGIGINAELISIQVASLLASGSLEIYDSDIVSALEWVYTASNSNRVAAVNMSLGGGYFTSPDACDAAFPAIKAAVDLLRNVGVASVVASGNGGHADGLMAPGCLSNVVSVGSTTKTDQVSGFSDSAPFLKLLAPGEQVYSSYPDDQYTYSSGTSMAAPHVAGAWALLRSRYPRASIDQILNALTTTGVNVSDPRSGLAKPRIDIYAALQALLNIPRSKNLP